MRCMLGTLALLLFVGCRSQTTGMTNPFLAPDRVPPPATRTLLPGTAQPYYPGDPVPNSPAIGAPPAGYPPNSQQTLPTYAPQPAGTVPPGGWNSAPQPIPGGASSNDVLPSTIQPTGAELPVTGQPQIRVQSDQQSLRFAGAAPLAEPPYPLPSHSAPAALRPDMSVLPTPQDVSPYPNQLASYQAPLPQPQFAEQSKSLAEPRQVRIRAVSSADLNANAGQAGSIDGFRPQGSSQVRKPTIASRLLPRKRAPIEEASDDRFGFDPRYAWLRGELQYAATTGQWTLHYAPADLRADPLDAQFGGSLTIANPHVLGNLQPGEYVQLRGRVEPLPAGTPVYNVSVVQRQRI